MVDVSDHQVRQLSNDLVVLSARLVREVRRNTTDLPAASTRLMSLLDELGPSTVGALAAGRPVQPADDDRASSTGWSTRAGCSATRTPTTPAPPWSR